MDIYPDFVFSCSQTQQMEWTEQNYPLLFKRIKTKVDKGQFIPIGGVSVSNKKKGFNLISNFSSFPPALDMG